MATKKKYITKSAVLPKSGGKEKFDSIAERKKQSADVRIDADLLHRFEQAWLNDDRVRREGERCHRYVYGDQWGDPTFYDGKWMTEREFLIKRGKVPLTNNVTRRIVTAVKGIYIKQKSEPRCIPFMPDRVDASDMIENALRTNWRRSYNRMSQQLSTALENYLIRGVAVMGESYERMPNGKYDAKTKLYDPRKVAMECNMSDPLMDDASLIGIIHDMYPLEFISKFGNKISRKTLDFVKEEYGDYKRYEFREMDVDNNEKNSLDYLNFYHNNDTSRWRFYEIWTKEIKSMYLCVDPANPIDPFKVEDLRRFGLDQYGGLSVMQENERRRKEAIQFGIPDEEVLYIDYGQFGEDGEFDGTGEIIDEYWYVRFLTPRGTIIDEYVSPYECGCPITIVKYPYVNGEVHSYINDVIPQQKYINRLVTLNDISIRSAAKGALLVDKRSIDGDQTQEEIRQQWGDPDGVVFYDSRRGAQPPRQVSNTSTNVGIDTALSMQLNLMEDISGVHGAAQGKEALSGQSGSLYAQQVKNSSTMLQPVLETFREFTGRVATKKASIINQFYETGRPINTYAADDYSDVTRFSRDLLDDMEYEITIINGDDTETAVSVGNEVAMQIFNRGAMDAKMLLEVGTWPRQFKDRAIRIINEQEAKMQQQQADAQQLAALQQALPQQQAQAMGNQLYNEEKELS